MTTKVTNKEIQHFSVPLESITCSATIHSYLTNLLYISFLLAPKRTVSWSQIFQKNGKYKVTTTVTNKEIQHFSVPLESITSPATIHSCLTNLVYIAFLLAPKQTQSWSQGFQKNGKYKVTTKVTNEEIQHFSATLESIICLATIHSYLTNLMLIAIRSAQRRIQS